MHKNCFSNALSFLADAIALPMDDFVCGVGCYKDKQRSSK